MYLNNFLTHNRDADIIWETYGDRYNKLWRHIKTMADTYTQLYVHIVFSVKGRHALIPKHHKSKLHKGCVKFLALYESKSASIFCQSFVERCAASVGASFARDRSPNVASKARSYRRKKTVNAKKLDIPLHKYITGIITNKTKV